MIRQVKASGFAYDVAIYTVILHPFAVPYTV
jgi:hypothetical protein